MILYENTLKLRETPPQNPYLAHQRVDFLIQETLRSKLPYSWRRMAHPLEPNSTVVFLRTPTPLNLPGEKTLETKLNVGDVLLCKTQFCYLTYRTNKPATPQNKPDNPSTDRLQTALQTQCEKYGLKLHTKTAGAAYKEYFNKKRHTFFLKIHPVSMVVEVTDTELAEQAIAYGIGLKRVFGYGQLTDIEVL